MPAAPCPARCATTQSRGIAERSSVCRAVSIHAKARCDACDVCAVPVAIHRISIGYGQVATGVVIAREIVTASHLRRWEACLSADLISYDGTVIGLVISQKPIPAKVGVLIMYARQ